MLPDVLQCNLRIVFCGTAAGNKSATLGLYYAGRGNKFWKVLNEVGLTPKTLVPSDYAYLPKYGIGLTDLVKRSVGSDNQVDFTKKDPDSLREKIERYQPKILCFNGKRGAQEFLMRFVSYGVQVERIGATRLFVVPSTSGAANRFWNAKWWQELAELSRINDL